MNYNILNHTADLAIEGVGKTAEEAIEWLSKGVLDQILPEGIESTDSRAIITIGLDNEELVVNYLSELLWLVQVDKWLISHVKVRSLGEDELIVEAYGEKFIEGFHHYLTEVKAATFHDFSFCKDCEGMWRLKVLFDV